MAKIKGHESYGALNRHYRDQEVRRRERLNTAFRQAIRYALRKLAENKAGSEIHCHNLYKRQGPWYDPCFIRQPAEASNAVVEYEVVPNEDAIKPEWIDGYGILEQETKGRAVLIVLRRMDERTWQLLLRTKESS